MCSSLVVHMQVSTVTSLSCKPQDDLGRYWIVVREVSFKLP